MFGSTLLLTLVGRNIGHFFVNYIVISVKTPKVNFLALSGSDYNFSLLRGVLSTLTSLFTTLGVKYLDITEALIIAQTKPILNFALNRFVFGDPITANQVISLILCLIGMVFVIQPPFIFGAGEYMLVGDKIKGFIYRLISVVWNSLADITLKKLGGKMDTLFVIHFMGMVNAVFFGVGYAVFDFPKPQSLPCYISLFFVGLFSWAVHYFYSKAYQMGNMNVVSIFEYTAVLMSFFVDYFLYNRSYNWYCYFGVAIVLAALCLSVSKK